MAVGFVGIYSLATYSYFYDKSLNSDPMYPTSAPNDTLRDSSDYVPRLQQSGWVIRIRISMGNSFNFEYCRC